MTDREKEILSILKKNPLISQKELASILSITRSSVAVHITNLMKKGYIKGKGYIIKKENYITIIGGSSIDIEGMSNNKLVMFDSNPGKINLSVGGAGMNLAEYIRKLGFNTKLISAIGNDLYGNTILSECKSYGIDVDDCYISSDDSTSIYISIFNNLNDMQLAISHMDITEKIDVNFINSKHSAISDSIAIILDTNLPEKTIDFITKFYSHIPILIDTVSSSKCIKVKNMVERFDFIKLSQSEAEILSDIKIYNEDDISRCCNYFLNKGVKRVFIKIGKDKFISSDGINLEETLKELSLC
ncbi:MULTISPECIES: PfkB family carbohydrate kinase [unclassified Romboutsia]|uniref:PfkB family carbohydrate kinase n=1 Tax=unclassified Romboutsia TaxID=2626894 RepID=UPI0008216858|nr:MULTISPECIES: PfkB family carbohydrate kinase [unclassified Romboutsia]SCI30853.1 Pseudouridine kinase [uncultured Clostridium sp.]